VCLQVLCEQTRHARAPQRVGSQGMGRGMGHALLLDVLAVYSSQPISWITQPNTWITPIAGPIIWGPRINYSSISITAVVMEVASPFEPRGSWLYLVYV